MVDARLDRAADAGDSVDEIERELVVPASASLSTTWHCPAVHLRRVAELGVEATADIVVHNTAARPTRARIELLSATSPPRVMELEVPGLAVRRASVEAAETDELVAAIVETPSGGVVVTRDFTSPLGVDSARCSTLPSDQWFIPTGDTQRDATDEVVLFNPLPSDAVVDLVFATEVETGSFVAVDLEGLVIPPRTPMRIDLGQHVRVREVVATAITVRSGRVVVDHFQAFDGSVGRVGFSSELATSTIGERWLFPSGRISDDQRMWVNVMNPSDEVAEVDLAAVTVGIGGDPVAITVGPREVAVVEVTQILDARPAVPTLEVVADTDFGIVVESANGVGVVVGVEVGWGPAAEPTDALDEDAGDEDAGDEAAESEADVEGDAAPADPEEDAPDEASTDASGSTRTPGHAFSPAIPRVGESWLLAVPGAGASGDADIAGVATLLVAVQAPTSQDRNVELRVLGGDVIARFSLPGAETRVVELDEAATLSVSADGPIAVSLIEVRTDGPGVGVSLPIGF